MTKTLTTILVVTILGLLVTLYFQRATIEKLRENTKKLQSLVNDNVQRQSASQAIPAVRTDSRQEPSPASTRQKYATQLKYLMNTLPNAPKASRLQISQEMVQKAWGTGLEVLNLPPEQIHKVKELLVERQESMADAFELSLSNGSNAEERAKAIDAAKQQVDAELHALLGPNDFSKVQTMITEQDDYVTISTSIGSDMAFAEVALSAPQTNSLADLLHKFYTSRQLDQSEVNKRVTNVDPATGLSATDQSALEEASDFLSDAQLKVLGHDLAISTATLVANSQPPPGKNAPPTK
jgi:hypothetical protein